MHKFEVLINWIRYALRPSAKNAAEAMIRFDQGVAAADTGNYRRAVGLFTKAIEFSPNAVAGMYHHRGRANAELGKQQEAINDYDSAVRLRPGYADFYIDRGNSYQELVDYDKAVKDYEEAIRLNPDLAIAYANRALIHMKSGNIDDCHADETVARSLGIDGEKLDLLLAEARRFTNA